MKVENIQLRNVTISLDSLKIVHSPRLACHADEMRKSLWELCARWIDYSQLLVRYSQQSVLLFVGVVQTSLLYSQLGVVSKTELFQVTLAVTPTEQKNYSSMILLTFDIYND